MIVNFMSCEYQCINKFINMLLISVCIDKNTTNLY